MKTFSWNVIQNSEREFELLNASGTKILLSKRVKVDIPKILAEMEEKGVPISFTNGLKQIYFTHLPGSVGGDYVDGKIRISCGIWTAEHLYSDLVHEIGHYLDDQEDLLSDELAEEKKEKGKYMTDSYARKNLNEYLACGFEVYFFGTKKEKKNLRKNNPVLFRTVKNVHAKYKRLDG